MPQSEARKRANAKWDAANMKIFSARVTLDIAEDFQAACAAKGKTPYAVIKDCIMQTIADYKKSKED